MIVGEAGGAVLSPCGVRKVSVVMTEDVSVGGCARQG